MVSQEIAEDSKIARCSDEAALTYAFTLPFLDRDGLCSGKPSWIAGRALQERPHLQTNAGSYIQEWIAQGLVIRYDGSDGPVLFFQGFRKHNPNLAYEKEARSKFPPPPGYHRKEDKNGVCHGLIPDDPEAAGRLSEAFDTRSLYHKALTEAAHHQETLEQSLGLEERHHPTQHKKVSTSSRPTPDLVEMNRREVEEEREGEGKGTEESNSNGASPPPAPAVALKDHPLIRAYFDLHNRYPSKAQMAMIVEHGPPIDNWVRAIRAWAMAGHNPTNIQGMIDWAFEPSRFEHPPAGKSPGKEQHKSGYSALDYLLAPVQEATP